MLDEYTGAFARYLRTGTVGALSDFCAEDADLARLRVYRNGFLKACIDALRASYPTVEGVTGEERFAALARPFVEANPPGTASLVEYGEGFPQHVRDTRDAHGLDWLASFASLDRAWTEVYFAADEAEAAERATNTGTPGAPSGAGGALPAGVRSASAGVTDGAPPEPAVPGAGAPSDAEALMNLRGRLSPRVRLVSLDYRVLEAWSRLRDGGSGPRVEIRHAPQQVLVWRSGAEMLYRDLTRPEHAFIASVASGRPCAEAAGSALDLDAEFDLVATFASLLHHRMLSFEH